MIKCPKDKFKVEKGFGTIKHCGYYDSKTTFWNDKCEIDAVYYYWKGELNYLSSWGFKEGSIYVSRRVKAKKANKPFFSFIKGWYGYE